MAANRFDQVIDAWDPRLRKAFLDAIYAVRNAAQIDQIARMLEKGDVDGALRAVGLDPVRFRVFDKAISDAFEAGGTYTANTLPSVRAADGLKLVFQFNVRNPAAEEWLSNHSSRKVSGIIDDQRTMVRNVLQAGLARGVNPRTAALDLVGRIGPSGKREGGMIGLTDTQSQWVANYEGELRSGKPTQALARVLRDKRFDRVVVKAEAAEQPLTETQINSMVTAYRNRALRFRAEAIARTEAITALHQAQSMAIEQAVQTGAINASAVTLIWNSAGDNRVRDAHAELDGESIPLGGTFDSALGPIRFPGDPDATAANIVNCRCWLEPQVDFLAGAG